MLGGHLTVAWTPTGAVPHVAAGRARVLAVLTERRAAVWPDVPPSPSSATASSPPVPYGIGVPAATPPAVVKALHDAFKKGLEDPVAAQALETVYYLTVTGLPPAEQDAFLAAHPDLYERSHGAVRVRIAEGMLSVGSLDCPGYASRALPDWHAMHEMKLQRESA